MEFKKAALAHDIGYLELPEALILKKDNLTEKEMRVVMLHTNKAARLLKRMNVSDLILYGVLYHHERLDGSGYIGLEGPDIPQIARIIAVADVFSALTSDRPHRPAIDMIEAISWLNENAGRLFDKQAVEILSKLEIETSPV